MGDTKSLAQQVPRSKAARLLGGVDRLGLADAVVRVAARTATGALPRRVAGLGLELSKIAVGRSTVAPDPGDRRFANRAWTENPAFRRLGQTYLACSKTAFDLVEAADLDWRTRERARFATALMTSTLAPTNVFPLNPDAVVRAYETGGRSVVSGLANIARDVRFNHGFPRTADPDAFEVGRNLAVTPGAVVFRNEVCELLQYAPTTDTVRATPIVLVPPQINKYYFMDLAPGRSFVEYVRRTGFPDVPGQLAQPHCRASRLEPRHLRRRRRRGAAGGNGDNRRRPGQHGLSLRRRDHNRRPPRAPGRRPRTRWSTQPPSPSPSSTSPSPP